MEKATFAGGCFWGVEDSFRSLAGVVSTRVGYCGGHTSEPTYRDVCGGDTGHAEAVEITFDPSLISYEQLLEIFWDSHDPTQLNRQGPDSGTQYRSAIFYHSEEQHLTAVESRDRLERSGRLRHPVVTAIQPADRFWEAEEYHQKYNLKHGLRCGF
jgi:peptide-methionine (S)-S-oxide reductase